MLNYLLNNIINLLLNNERNKSKRRAVFKIISAKATFILKAAFI
jgi:hypothetical protein